MARAEVVAVVKLVALAEPPPLVELLVRPDDVREPGRSRGISPRGCGPVRPNVSLAGALVLEVARVSFQSLRLDRSRCRRVASTSPSTIRLSGSVRPSKVRALLVYDHTAVRSLVPTSP